MARVTVEDCVEKVPNRFELVLLAAQRSRDVSAGAEITIDRDNDKNPVVALREIAEETVDHAILTESLVRSLQKVAEVDEPEEEEPMEMMAAALSTVQNDEELPSGMSIQATTDAAEAGGGMSPSVRYDDVDESSKLG